MLLSFPQSIGDSREVCWKVWLSRIIKLDNVRDFDCGSTFASVRKADVIRGQSAP